MSCQAYSGLYRKETDFDEVSWRPKRTHQNDTQAPEVTGLVVAIVVQELRRGIMESEARRLERLIVGRLEACKPEINDFNFQIVIFVSEQ